MNPSQVLIGKTGSARTSYGPVPLRLLVWWGFQSSLSFCYDEYSRRRENQWFNNCYGGHWYATQISPQDQGAHSLAESLFWNCPQQRMQPHPRSHPLTGGHKTRTPWLMEGQLSNAIPDQNSSWSTEAAVADTSQPSSTLPSPAALTPSSYGSQQGTSNLPADSVF